MLSWFVCIQVSIYFNFQNGWGSKKDVLKDLQVCSDFTTDEPQAHLLERAKEPSEPDYEEYKESWNTFDHIQNLFQTKTVCIIFIISFASLVLRNLIFLENYQQTHR